MANGTYGAQDSVQRMWGPVQVGAAGARIPTRGEPDIRVDEALEFAPESVGAPAAEGDATVVAAAAAAVHPPSEHGFRRTQRRRLLDPPAPGPGFQAPDIVRWAPRD